MTIKVGDIIRHDGKLGVAVNKIGDIFRIKLVWNGENRNARANELKKVGTSDVSKADLIVIVNHLREILRR